MALHIVTSKPDGAVLGLPWSTPLAAWSEDFVVPLPRGLSRHIVRIVRLGDRTVAIKETQEEMAFREYRLLRELERLQLPAVRPLGVITGRVDESGEPLPCALMTQHLAFSLPYRALFAHGMSGESLPSLVDALVVLLVRLHVARFYWGDVSLSNVLFRRSAGGFSAFLVDAETGELRPTLSPRMREWDIQVAVENTYVELLDLQAAGWISSHVDGRELVRMIEQRYTDLWDELTGEEQFSADETWRIQERIERLNDLGFDVDELDIITDHGGDRIRIQPKAVELGHHRRELQSLTGLNVLDAQARRLLNDIAWFVAANDLGREDRGVAANRWLIEMYEPALAMVPPDARGKLEPAEIYHEMLVHRWYLSERAGHEIGLLEAASDYIANVLALKPNELITPDDASALNPELQEDQDAGVL